MKKAINLVLLIALTTLNAFPIAQAVTSSEATTLLNNCVAAINDPLYTRATLPGIMSYNGVTYANAAAIESAIVAGTLNIWVATTSGSFGTLNGSSSDLYCGNSQDNSVSDLDSAAGKRDYFFGGGGNDSVTNMWESVFYGGPGNDTVSNMSEASVFYGGPGTDAVTSKSSDSVFYQEDPDTTPPTFPSQDNFSVAENTTNVGVVIANESATITIFGGEDQSKFTITKLSDSSTSLSFLSAPNFEIPTDVGLNNTYIVVFKAVDTALNSGYETVTVTVTDVDETSSFTNFVLSANAIYRTSNQISATINVNSKVTFYLNNTRIPGCVSKPTAVNAPFTVTCNWSPSIHGEGTLIAFARPIAIGISSSVSSQIKVFVNRRTTTR